MSGFEAWLAEHHSGVVLTRLQAAWVQAVERGEAPIWVGGRASGKKFVLNLWREYVASQQK